jgi:ParB family chromosome partitioning protein
VVERKKRGLGRGLGALIPDANSNDRPVDVFFSGGNSEDGRREGEQKTSRTARTDPAASMQSSRRRKSKAGADTQTSSASSTTSTTRKTVSKDSSGTAASEKAGASKKPAAAEKSAAAKKPAATTKSETDNKPASSKKPASGTTSTKSKSTTAGKTAAPAKTAATGKTTAASKSTSSKASKSPASDSSTSKTTTGAEPTGSKATGPKSAAAESSVASPSSSSAASPSAASSETTTAAESAASAMGNERAVVDVVNDAEPAPAPDDVRETHPGVYTSSGDSAAAEETSGEADAHTTAVVNAAQSSAAADVESTSVSTSDVSNDLTDDTSVDNASEDEDSDSYEGVESIPDTEFGEIDVDLIDANPRQPRTVFDEDLLAELVHSIREIGVLQPVVVRQKPSDHSRFELIMGERRLRATKDAGLSTIPAIIRYVEDTDLLRDALLENLHRAELNPLEEAAAYGQLLEDFGCTQEELSERIGRSRPQISNTLRLLRLPPLVQRRVAAGVISAGHARAILGLRDPEHMEVLAQRIVAEGLSVRASEEAVVLLNRGDSINVSRATSKVSPEFLAVAERLGDRLDTKVNITVGKRKGKLSVEFANQEDLDRILSLLGIADGEAF